MDDRCICENIEIQLIRYSSSWGMSGSRMVVVEFGQRVNLQVTGANRFPHVESQRMLEKPLQSSAKPLVAVIARKQQVRYHGIA